MVKFGGFRDCLYLCAVFKKLKLKTIMRKLKFAVLLATLISVGGGRSYAHDIEVANADGVTIYYNYINNRTELEVTYQGTSFFSMAYTGKVVIPESVNTYLVASISDHAFWFCSGLTEVAIPNSVTSIGERAFSGCSSLTEVAISNSVISIGGEAFHNCFGLTEMTIPNSVTSIGDGAFQFCGGLKELTIGNSVTSIGNSAFENCGGLKELTIPNSVTSIGDYAFSYCSGLTELTIPNSVTSIGSSAFGECSGLTEVTIPNSVTSIEQGVFSGCSSLTSVTIPGSVTSIGNSAFSHCRVLKELTIPGNVTSIGSSAFYGCVSLTEMTIPNSVTSIGSSAFSYCGRLTEVTIGNSVTSIGERVFEFCYGLTTLYSLNTTPPNAYTSTFASYHYTNVDVYAPQEALAAYKSAEVWKEFQKLQVIETEKCATPTIHYANNKLTFKCETEGVTYESTITDTDIASYSNDEIDLSVTYTVTVYATKKGYVNSDVATATLCWIDVEPKTEGTTDDNTAVQQISATPVLIQSANGQITVTGLTDGTAVAVYDLSGQQVGTATSTGGQATVSTGLTTGTAAIVKMGDNKSVKIAVK